MKLLRTFLISGCILAGPNFAVAEKPVTIKGATSLMELTAIGGSCQAIAKWCHSYSATNKFTLNMKSVTAATVMDMEKHDFIEVKQPVNMTILVEGLFDFDQSFDVARNERMKMVHKTKLLSDIPEKSGPYTFMRYLVPVTLPTGAAGISVDPLANLVKPNCYDNDCRVGLSNLHDVVFSLESINGCDQMAFHYNACTIKSGEPSAGGYY